MLFRSCEAIAYGVKLAGGTIVGETLPNKDGEYIWRDDAERELTWRVDSPPACGTLQIIWRVKTFPVKRGPLDPPSDGDEGCCGQTFPNSANKDGGTKTVILRRYLRTGDWDASKTKLPAVCGCTCSSAVVTPPTP